MHQNIQPEPSANSMGIADKPIPEIKYPRNDKLIKMIILGVIVFFALAVSGYYFFIYKNNSTNIRDSKAAIFTPEEDEFDYYNQKYNFKLITKKAWNINEFGTKVEFNVNSEGKIYFEAFDDNEFANIKLIDQRFCDSFEEGFKEGLAGNEVANAFDFKLFTQNNLDGCVAEGEILEGFRQKYNVFYNPADQLVYSIFYTSANPENEELLSKTLSTFRIAL